MGGYPMWRGLLGIPPVRVGPTPEQPPTQTRTDTGKQYTLASPVVPDPLALAATMDAYIAAQATAPADIRSLPAVAGAVRLISSTIDQLPLRAPGDVEWLLDPRSRGGQLDAGDLIQHCVDSMVNHGRAYLWCTPTKTPNAWRLDAVDPGFVHVKRVDDAARPGVVLREFHVQGVKVEEVPYTAANATGPVLLHIPYVVTVDHPEGTTPLTQAASILRGHVHTEAAVAAMFGEGSTRVGGILTTEHDITPAQGKEWQSAITEAWRARRIPVLGNGLTYRNEAPNARDLQLVEARSFNQSVVWALLGIPLDHMGSSLVGGQSSLSYANAQDNRRKFADNCLRAFTTQIEDAISRLLPYGSRAAFDYTEWEGRTADGAPDATADGVPPA